MADADSNGPILFVHLFAPRACSRCGVDLPAKKRSGGAQQKYCESCRRSAAADWQKRNREARASQRPALIKHCAACKSPFKVGGVQGKPRTYCEACKPDPRRTFRQQQPKSVRYCLDCRNVLTGHSLAKRCKACQASRKAELASFASKAAWQAGRRRRKLRGPFCCVNCGNEYHTRRPEGEGEKFCSRACAFVDLKQRSAPDWSPIYFKACEICGIQSCHRKNNLRPLCADPQCLRTYESRRVAKYTENKALRINGPKKLLVCGCCNKEFKQRIRNQKMFCSQRCANKAAHRARKAMERASKKARTAERFDPVKVLRRDNWICQCCGAETPEAKRGTHEANAPELDHAIPLSKGGPHTQDNTRCLCRQCNIAKGGRVTKEAVEWLLRRGGGHIPKAARAYTAAAAIGINKAMGWGVYREGGKNPLGASSTAGPAQH